METGGELVVVKVGTNVLQASEGLDTGVIEGLCNQLARLLEARFKVVLVSSGAVGAGKLEYGVLKTRSPVLQQQIFAAIGQIGLMGKYKHHLSRAGITAAQVLATKEDFRDRRHYINMRNCLHGLIQEGILPIVNENDVVSLRELMFTDNDELAGLIGAMLNADRLAILTSVPGLMTHPPESPLASVISKVTDLAELDQVDLAGKSKMGRGGMASKIDAVRKAAKLGMQCHILPGKEPDVLTKVLLENEIIGTVVEPSKGPTPVKKWLASVPSEHTLGAVIINQGAEEALRNATNPCSLLPVGVVRTNGNFIKGDVISIQSESGQLVGLGIASYDQETLRQSLGQNQQKAIIHYNYLYLLD